MCLTGNKNMPTMVCLNPVSHTLDYLDQALNTIEQFNLRDFQFIEKVLNKPLPAHEPILRYLDWCNKREYVKVIKTEVPSNIASSEVACFLNDIKVQPKKHRSDDEIYTEHQDIRDKIARGNCIFELDKKPAQYHFVISGLKKFTGGPGDEDDDNDDQNFASDCTWQKFFLKPIKNAVSFSPRKPMKEAHSVIALKKLNGEAAHFSARWFDSELLLFAGSKNVHMAFKNMEDINKYAGQRYSTACKVARAVLQLLDDIGKAKAELLLNFLHYTRLTAVMEILCPDNMHVEDLSSLKRCELHFLIWMDTDLTGGSPCENLCGLPPGLGVQVASVFGFKTFDQFATLAPDQVDEKLQQIRRNYGYEGEVLYYLDANQAVFGIVKRKTIWYILLRAIREKGKLLGSKMKKSPQDLSVYTDLWRTRLEDLEKWLQLENSIVIKWRRLGIQFLKWVYQEIHKGSLKHEQLELTFPVVWQRFLEAKGYNDKLD